MRRSGAKSRIACWVSGAWALAVASTLSAGVLVSCAPVARTSLHDPAEVVAAAGRFRESLAGSAWLRGRNESSPEIRLLCDKVENFSSDRLSRTEQLTAVYRVVSDEGMLEVLRGRNVKVYFGPRDEDVLATVVGSAEWRKWSSPEKPTHLLRARFNSITRVAASMAGQLTDQRSDDFQVRFSILEDGSGATVWSDLARFRRTSVGLQID
ncbi:hypothetical protein BH11PLA1_BH11PLA1_20930 [soil metagenome]